ncbi:acetolactate synthase, large chain related protein [Pseudomonas putida S11]|nr:acetolactate synthase, large chain related protein [Pseudomonas putida S11]
MGRGTVIQLFRHAQLVHIDIDPQQVGKRHEVELAVIADAKLALEGIGSALKPAQRKRIAGKRAQYLKEVIALKKQWEDEVELLSNSDCTPFNLQRPLLELRSTIESEAIIVVGIWSG